MATKLKYLVKMSLNKKIKSKWFVVINILLIALVVALMNIETVISKFGGDFSKPTNIAIKDNTGEAYQTFSDNFDSLKTYLSNPKSVKLVTTTESRDELIKSIGNNSKNIVIIIDKDANNYMKAEVVSDVYIDTILYQIITNSLNTTKSTLAMSKSDINQSELNAINAPVNINRNILDESKKEQDETISSIMGIVFPAFILPFFMLIIFLVQMIGGEINEEKTTRSMEIIISNVSPKTHFISKILASNIFVLLQAVILFIAGVIGGTIRGLTSSGRTFNLSANFDIGAIWDQLASSGIAARLVYVIPVTILLIILSFLAYSLVAGILASMTTSIEDFQQVQTPIILICGIGYYLATLAPTFEGSIFIRIISYLPFISVLVSPPLLLIGQIGFVDVAISFLLLLGTIYFMLTYGMKIYKVGILNYSTSKIWRRMFRAVKD